MGTDHNITEEANHNGIVTVNGKKLAFAEYGDRDGFPVFYFHGFPGSRLEGRLLGFDDAGKKAGVKFYCPDRPGMGLSDYQPNRRLTDWPADIAGIADSLGIGKFSVIGLSGGGPYALAAARLIPGRLHRVAVVSGMVPYEYPGAEHDISMSVPRLPVTLRKPAAWLFRMGTMHASYKIARQFLNVLPGEDQAFLFPRSRLKGLLEDYREGFRQGIQGYLHEAGIYRNNWGFSLSAINTPVYVWHGKPDRNVGIERARKLAESIPGCQAGYFPDEGHFSLIGNHLTLILSQLTGTNM